MMLPVYSIYCSVLQLFLMNSLTSVESFQLFIKNPVIYNNESPPKPMVLPFSGISSIPPPLCLQLAIKDINRNEIYLCPYSVPLYGFHLVALLHVRLLNFNVLGNVCESVLRTPRIICVNPRDLLKETQQQNKWIVVHCSCNRGWDWNQQNGVKRQPVTKSEQEAENRNLSSNFSTDNDTDNGRLKNGAKLKSEGGFRLENSKWNKTVPSEGTARSPSSRTPPLISIPSKYKMAYS